MEIGIFGATGPAGRGLAARLAAVGHDVVVGSRDPERAKGIVEELRKRWGDRVATLRAAHNEEAAACEIVVIAVAWEAAADTAAAHAEALAGKTVVSMANGLEKIRNEFRAVMPDEGSVALAVQAAAPAAHVTAAFHHVPAAVFADLDSEMEDDITVVGDDDGARATVIELVSSIPGVRAFDGGSLNNSVGLEAFAAVLLTANLRHHGRGSVALRGIEP
ncbi:MAG: NADPH-dependent F420 reductase [Acidimicrobiia bacterium]|nr:NADPH-dependent F420 reductase [Acidimicrobiia bacterium]